MNPTGEQEGSRMNSNEEFLSFLRYLYARWEVQSQWKERNGKWQDDRARRFEEICSKVCKYSPEKIAMLTCMLGFVETVVIDGHQSSLVMYTNSQPPRCDGSPVLTYGRLPNVVIRNWIARIYFTDDGPRIAFPNECLKSQRRSTAEICLGTSKGANNNAFVPKDILDFFKEALIKS